MTALLRYALLLALVVWIGSIIFFSFVASPSIFKILPRDQAGQVVGDIFPKYHLLGYVSCLVALGALLSLRQIGGASSLGMAMILLLVMGGIQLTMGTLVGPKVVEARDAVRVTPSGPEKERLEKRFRALHGISMILNLGLLILGLILLYRIGIRLQL